MGPGTFCSDPKRGEPAGLFGCGTFCSDPERKEHSLLQTFLEAYQTGNRPKKAAPERGEAA